MRLGETLGITVSLEDEFADIESVRVPLRNLTISDPPSISMEYSLINFTAVRRKVLRYRARAIAAGPAVVGPIVLNAGAQTDTLPPIVVEVIPDRAASSNDPEVIFRELVASGREPLFVVAESEKQTVHVGEQILVTWYLYNGSTVQRWQIGSIPKLEDFWVEELDVRSSRAESTVINGEVLQKLPVRRVAVYPLRSGQLEIGPMEVEAAIMRRSSSRGPFSIFEGHVVEIAFASAPVPVSARPIPAGAAVSAVGDLTLECSPPKQEGGGPVIVNAVLQGRGNLRSAEAPAFVSSPHGEVQRIERGLGVTQTADSAWMTREWQYLIFPRQSGQMAVPQLQLPVFSTATGERRLLRCTAATLAVTAADRPRLATSSTPRTPAPAQPLMTPVVIAGGVAGAFLLFVLPWWRRRSKLNRKIRGLIADGDPVSVRENVHATLAERGIEPSSLLREGSDRGDAYRSLRSLLDALEKDRIDVDDRDREIRRRIRELLLT